MSKIGIRFQFTIKEKDGGLRLREMEIRCNTSTPYPAQRESMKNKARRYCNARGAQLIEVLSKPFPKIISPHPQEPIPLRAHAPSSSARR